MKISHTFSYSTYSILNTSFSDDYLNVLLSIYITILLKVMSEGNIGKSILISSGDSIIIITNFNHDSFIKTQIGILDHFIILIQLLFTKSNLPHMFNYFNSYK